MAAPPQKTLKDLNGSWSLNKKLSDDVQAGLKLQGFNFIMRKLFANAPIYTKLTQWEQDGIIHIKTVSTTTANAPAGELEWIFDFTSREKKDPGLGNLTGKARFVTALDDMGNDQYLAEGWIAADGTEHFEFMIESLDNGWTSHQVWGFEEINGERRFTSRNILTKKQERILARVVYDYTGELN